MVTGIVTHRQFPSQANQSPTKTWESAV